MLPHSDNQFNFQVRSVTLEKSKLGATCGTPLPPRSGPDRPAVYCCAGCRQTTEFRIRSLVRRIDQYALERRECGAEGVSYDEADRQQRMRVLKRWLEDDRSVLRRLLAGKTEGEAA